jgi:hypothetical protein
MLQFWNRFVNRFFFFLAVSLYLVSLYLAVCLALHGSCFELPSLAMEPRFLSEKKKTFHILIPGRIVKQFYFSFRV